jgi:hypothetical protein
MEKKPLSSFPVSRLFLPGQRIVLSVFAVWLCMLLYYLRGFRGEPFYSVIAALQCVQPYSSNMIKEGRDRIIGTLIGAFWGGVVLYAELLPVGSDVSGILLHYLLLGLFSGLVIYSTVLFRISKYALFSTVVFLGIAMYHIEDTVFYVHIFNRTMDTILGVGIAFFVNSVHLPRIRDCSTLFVSGIDHVLFREDRQLSSFTLIELNRYLDEGMRFSVSTKQTPATVHEVLAGVHFRLPIIAMDGAVLYDLNTMKYVRAHKMEPDLVQHISDFLHGEGMPFFVNTIQDQLLVIYFKDYKDLILEEVKDSHRTDAQAPQISEDEDFTLNKSAYLCMSKLYKKKRVSPYRNYVRTDTPITEDVVYIQVIDLEDHIDRLREKLMSQPWADRLRTNYEVLDCDEGEKIMRIYTASANRDNMLEHLRRITDAPRVITFSNIEGRSDVLVRDPSRDQVVKELKKRFKPVSIRGWRNIFHL